MPPKRQFTGKFTKKPFKRSYNNNDDGDDSTHKRFKPSTASSSNATTKAPDGTRHTDEEGNAYWELGGKARRVTVSEFKGNVLVSVREYYEKDGKYFPGKKGISMSLDQFNQLIKVLPSIEQAIGQKSTAGVVRPNYTTAAKHDAPKSADAESGAEDEDEDEADEKQKYEEEDSDAEDIPAPKKSKAPKSESKGDKKSKSKKRQEESEDEEEEEEEEEEAEESEED
ncbi:hypothetical protein TWF696_004205 [Orbilia brochopaga]|uniref:Transcriptional coactivator p15 (PC4) C-terminal domain-containing protein n=1 Tax=Orbilia brochopaga TaxID=3140254 RepID=A0AAV9VBY4_9PEZI